MLCPLRGEEDPWEVQWATIKWLNDLPLLQVTKYEPGGHQMGKLSLVEACAFAFAFVSLVGAVIWGLGPLDRRQMRRIREESHLSRREDGRVAAGAGGAHEGGARRSCSFCPVGPCRARHPQRREHPGWVPWPRPRKAGAPFRSGPGPGSLVLAGKVAWMDERASLRLTFPARPRPELLFPHTRGGAASSQCRPEGWGFTSCYRLSVPSNHTLKLTRKWNGIKTQHFGRPG